MSKLRAAFLSHAPTYDEHMDEIKGVLDLVESTIGGPEAPANLRMLRTVKKLAEWRVAHRVMLVTVLQPLLAYGMALTALHRYANEQVLRWAERTQSLLAESDQLSTSTRFGTASVILSGKLFAAAYDEYEPVVVCAADHLGAAYALPLLSHTEQAIWARTSEQCYIPLLHLLGMGDERTTLADQAFEYVLSARERRPFEDCAQECQQRHKELGPRLIDAVRAALKRREISAMEPKLHASSAGELYLRSLRAARNGHAFNFEHEHAVLRLDVVVNDDDSQAPFRAIGVLHALGRPILQLTDYINAPRHNGYGCLVSTIAWNESRDGRRTQAVELRVCTQGQDIINREGLVAAHLRPRERTVLANQWEDHRARPWWEDLRTRALVSSPAAAREAGVVPVFTPEGEVKLLRAGGTALDYAFHIHSQLGIHARAYFVNGRPAEPDTELPRCAVVEVRFDPHWHLGEEWIPAATMKTARRALRQAAQRAAGAESDGVIERVVRRELKICGLRIPTDEIERLIGQYALKHGFGSAARLNAEVSRRRAPSEPSRVAPDEVANAIVESLLLPYIERADAEVGAEAATHDEAGTTAVEEMHISRCWLDLWGSGAVNSREQRVYPGVEIVGIPKRLGKRTVLFIHRADCARVAHKAVVPLRWRRTAQTREAVQITLEAWDKPRLLGDVLDAIYQNYRENRSGVYLHRAEAKVIHETGAVRMEFLLDAPSFGDFEPLRDTLERMRQDGLLHTIDIMRYLPGQQVLITDPERRRLNNPYTVGAIPAAQAMFFGRSAELDELIALVRQGKDTLALIGPVRMGKTWLVNKLHERITHEVPEVIPVSLDGLQMTPTPEELLSRMARGALKAVEAAAHRDVPIPHLKAGDLKSRPFDNFLNWIRRLVREHAPGHRVVFLIDEFTSFEVAWREGTLDEVFFRNMRWLGGARDVLQLLLVVHDTVVRDDPALSAGGANPQPGIQKVLNAAIKKHLGPLDERATQQMIVQPLGYLYKYERELVDRIVTLTGCQPYYVALLCHGLTQLMSRNTRTRVTLADLEVVQHADWTGGAGQVYFDRYERPLRATPERYRLAQAIALASGDEYRWVSVQEIARALRSVEIRATTDRKLLADVEELHELGVVELRPGEAGELGKLCRIELPLYHWWLRRGFDGLEISARWPPRGTLAGKQ